MFVNVTYTLISMSTFKTLNQASFAEFQEKPKMNM